LQIHNSTVYRWNRPCYGISDTGKPHLRIENRVISAGPTVVDEMANAAFWLGLMIEMGERYEDITQFMSFSDARDNFRKAARYGIDTTFTWLNDEKISACDLTIKYLIPIAREGMSKRGVDETDINKYLGIIQERAEASENIKDLMVNAKLTQEIRNKKMQFIKNSIPKTWIVIDEAQNVIPSGRKTSASESLIKLVKEGRNFGLSFVVTTQQPRALDVNVLSQVETFIIHKLVSQTDIDYILDNLKCPFPSEIKDDYSILTPRDLIRDIGVGQAVISDTNTRRCFVMEVRPRVSVHGGFEA